MSSFRVASETFSSLLVPFHHVAVLPSILELKNVENVKAEGARAGKARRHIPITWKKVSDGQSVQERSLSIASNFLRLHIFIFRLSSQYATIRRVPLPLHQQRQHS